MSLKWYITVQLVSMYRLRMFVLFLFPITLWSQGVKLDMDIGVVDYHYGNKLSKKFASGTKSSTGSLFKVGGRLAVSPFVKADVALEVGLL